MVPWLPRPTRRFATFANCWTGASWCKTLAAAAARATDSVRRTAWMRDRRTLHAARHPPQRQPTPRSRSLVWDAGDGGVVRGLRHPVKIARKRADSMYPTPACSSACHQLVPGIHGPCPGRPVGSDCLLHFGIGGVHEALGTAKALCSILRTGNRRGHRTALRSPWHLRSVRARLRICR